jgi:hypothetical protein
MEPDMATKKKAAAKNENGKITVRNVMVTIVRDTMTTIPKIVRPWEVPMLEEIHGQEQVLVNGAVEKEIDELPDAQEEFDRLVQTYGTNGDTKNPYVQIVYGNGRAGVKALEEAIEASANGDVEAAQAVYAGDKAAKELGEARSKRGVDMKTGERVFAAPTQTGEAEEAEPIDLVNDDPLKLGGDGGPKVSHRITSTTTIESTDPIDLTDPQAGATKVTTDGKTVKDATKK